VKLSVIPQQLRASIDALRGEEQDANYVFVPVEDDSLSRLAIRVLCTVVNHVAEAVVVVMA